TRPTCKSRGFRGSTWASPRSIRRPPASVTVTVLKDGSRSPSNQMRTSVGAVPTTAPTRGSERSGKACAPAPMPVVSSNSPMIPGGRTGRIRGPLLEDRPEDRRVDVVQEEVEQGPDADVLAGLAVDRDHGLDAHLHVLPGPDEAGVDGPGRLAPVERGGE